MDEVAAPVASFRHGRQPEPDARAERAWVKRVKQLAAKQETAAFSSGRLREAVPALLACSGDPEGIGHAPEVLAAAGVRFVVLKHLPKTYIDGAVVELEDGPAVGMTLRYDRIDAFWFTLMHELAHIAHDQVETRVETLYGDGAPESSGQEADADRTASDWLLDPALYASFVQVNRPYFSRSVIEDLAAQAGRHPAIVVGRLQHDGHVPYSQLRSLLVNASPHLSGWMYR